MAGHNTHHMLHSGIVNGRRMARGTVHRIRYSRSDNLEPVYAYIPTEHEQGMEG